MTQKQIAAACGTTQPTISGLIRGVRKRTSYETGAAIDRLHEATFSRRKK